MLWDLKKCFGIKKNVLGFQKIVDIVDIGDTVDLVDIVDIPDSVNIVRAVVMVDQSCKKVI